MRMQCAARTYSRTRKRKCSSRVKSYYRMQENPCKYFPQSIDSFNCILKKTLLNNGLCDIYRYIYRYSAHCDKCEVNKLFSLNQLLSIALIQNRIPLEQPSRYNVTKLKGVLVICSRCVLSFVFSSSSFFFSRSLCESIGRVQSFWATVSKFDVEYLQR